MYGLAMHVVDGAPPVFHVAGDIDMANADEFSKDLKDALSAHPTLVLDMAGVTFLDAAGLRVILRIGEARNGQGPLPIVNAQRVRWLLDLVGHSETAAIVTCDGE
jgi:anti-anti-sigma factor